MSFAKTWRQMEDGTKTVTRRNGWRFLRPGDRLTAIEWSPRLGTILAKCPACGRLMTLFGQVRFHQACRNSVEATGKDWSPEFRAPRRIELEAVAVWRERLGGITPEEIVREGFPGMSRQDFMAMFCDPRKPDPDLEVTRIQFVYKDPAGRCRPWSREQAGG